MDSLQIDSLQTFAKVAILPFFFFLNIVAVIWSYFRADSSTFEDFVGGGRRVSMKMLTMTLLAAMVSGLEVTSFNYVLHYGALQVIRTSAVMVGAFFVVSLMLPSLSKSNKYLTLGDVLGETHGKMVKILTGLIVLWVSFFVFFANVNLMMLMSEYLLETDEETFPSTVEITVMILGIALVYLLLGGVRGMHYTHMIQMTGVIVTLLCLAFFLLHMAGGLEGFWNYLPEDRLLFASHPDFFYFLRTNVLRIPLFMFTVLIPMFPRVAKLEDKQKIKKAGIRSVVLYGLVVFLVFFLALSALSLNEELGIYGDSVHFFMLLRSVFDNQIILKLLFVGILGIFLSSIDTYLHIAAVSLVHDIIIPLVSIVGIDAWVRKYRLFFTRVSMILLFMLFLGLVLFFEIAKDLQFYSYWCLTLISTVMLGALVAVMLDEA